MGDIPQLVGSTTQWYNGDTADTPLHSKHTSGIIWVVSPIAVARDAIRAVDTIQKGGAYRRKANRRLFSTVYRNDKCMHIVANQ
jgi:hypothetical protein